MIRKLLNAIRDTWLTYTHYRVLVNWEGLVVVHWARTKEEAWEWANCYPFCFVHCSKRDKFLFRFEIS